MWQISFPVLKIKVLETKVWGTQALESNIMRTNALKPGVMKIHWVETNPLGRNSGLRIKVSRNSLLAKARLKYKGYSACC